MKQLSGKLLVIFGLIFGLSSFAIAQNTSNKGTDFWLAYSGHIDGKVSKMTLFLSSDITTTYKVEGLGQTIASGTITANTITPVFIDPAVFDVHIASSDLVEINKGIHITTGSPISVYAVISNSARTAGSLILPTKSLGKEYYAFSYQNVGGAQNGNAKSEFTIVAVEDDTEIEITPTVSSTSGTRTANTTFKIPVKLNKGDVYQYQSVNDVSGSIIKTLGTCKPIAVFSGNTWAAFCEDGNTITNPNVTLPGKPTPSGGDNLYQQLFPISAWGKNFVTAPFYNTENGNIDAIRIIVSEDNTNISVNGSSVSAFGTALANPYKKGSIITYFTNKPSIVKADRPIGVAQYQSAQNCNASNRIAVTFPGDPEMTILNPIEQTLSDITVFSKLISVPGVRTNINKYYLNIILKTVDAPTLKVDGLAVSGFKTIDAEYSYVIIDVSTSQDQHRIVANGGFVAIAYGYGAVESYAYLAGADVKNLFQNITANNQSNLLISSNCVNKSSKFILKLPYQTSNIVWDVNDGNGPFTQSAPAFTTSLIDGRTIYSYVYPRADPVYSAAGKYLITAVAINPNPSGCNALEVVSFEFEIFNKPSAVYTATLQSCANTKITFTDASQGNGKSIKKWFWDFGDNEFSTDKNPMHTYAASGDYSVKLMVEGETGCQSDVVTQIVHVIALPLVNFSTSLPACESKDITFTDLSTTAEGNIIKWTWDFGDGSTVEEKTSAAPFSHKYLLAGTYNVKLKVVTDKGCESIVFEKSIVINPAPIVNFGIPEICIRDSFAQFTDSTTIADGSALSYLWDFGNPISGSLNSSNLKNPTHKYTIAGTYQVSLTVTSASGCVNKLVKSFQVSGAVPKADFLVLNSTQLCSNKEVVFRNTSTVDFGTIGKVEWFFDYGGDLSFKLVDENPFPGKEYRIQYPIFSAPASKQFIVRMLAYSGGVCNDEEIQTIELKPIPIVNFGIPESCIAEIFSQFTDLSSISDGKPLSYLWNFGNPSAGELNSSTLKNPTHKYTVAGDYPVTLTVTSESGCVKSLVKTFKVSGAVPKAKFLVLNDTELCSNREVVFRNTSTIDFGIIEKLEWFFDYGGDLSFKLVDENPMPGKEYRIQYPIFSAPASKQFRVRMVAYSGGVCTDDEIQTIILKSVPEVVFTTIPDVCQEVPPFKLTQASEKNSQVGIGIYSGNGVSPSGIFSTAQAGVGKHTIKYVFTTNNGCADSLSREILVMPTPALFAGRDTIILEGGEVKLYAKASGNNLTYKWVPSIGLSRDDILDPVASPLEDITYVLTVTSDQGCVSVDAIFVKVLKAPEVPNAFTPNGDGINDLWNIKYLESYVNASVKVFSRYGSVVYYSVKGYSQPWKGQMNGNDLPMGTYYYIIDPKTKGRKLISGSVTIIR